MKNQGNILMFDLWKTLIYCEGIEQKIQKFIEILSSSPNYDDEEIFRDWKNMWFKKDIDLSEFIFFLSDKYELSITKQRAITEIIPYTQKEINLYPDTLPVLDTLQDNGVELILVSDSGPDSKQYVIEQGLINYFKHIFFSFEKETTKNEALYDIVVSKLSVDPISLTMIGDDYKRDYLIPKQKGISAVLLDRDRQYNLEDSIHTLHEIIPLILENGN